MIMECAEPDYSGLEKFNTKLKRMIATKYQASSSEDKHVTSLTTFLEVSLKDTHWLVKYFLEPQKEPPRKVSEPVQFYVIAQLIKKMFESDDISSLETLKAYFCINPLSVSAAPVCIPLIMRGLTQLLNLASGTQACVDIYPDVLQMITACKVKDPGAFEDLRPVFQSLMLSQDPTVRKVIVDWLKSCDVSEQSSIRHLMKAVATLLSPVLVIKHDEKMDRSSHGDFDGWYSIPGTFNGHPASLLMRPSTLEEILSSRPRHFDDVGDELSLNHVNILRHLRHENIITLFAYNTRHIPIFYVMEDSTNLQEYLRQRKAKRTYCSDATLVKYLSQAAAALQYCHCRNVVLRDITAASFVVTGSDTIKLASFHLAFTLAEKETERIVWFKESIMISSRRWPPESMRRNTWSKMSDIWMFGQLIYNVFTDVDVSDSEIGLERDEPNIRLQSDRCIDNIAIETIVSACAHLDPNQRANISNTINSLDLLIHKVTESPGRSATGSSLTNKTYNPKIDTTIKKLWDTGEDLSELRLIERALGSELGLNDYELEKMDVGYRRAHSSTRPSKADDRHLDMLLINPSDSESDYYSGNDSDD
ncbi:unnamed protein product [Lymnaea stagnalis]|uniref:Protein kinase domain-containing protein n=1 Tax=Lymnaea stagnalis TaxID=6523 RepID=A0AAV2H2M1_LYMST